MICVSTKNDRSNIKTLFRIMDNVCTIKTFRSQYKLKIYTYCRNSYPSPNPLPPFKKKEIVAIVPLTTSLRITPKIWKMREIPNKYEMVPPEITVTLKNFILLPNEYVVNIVKLFHEWGPYHVESRFYMIGTSVMNQLITFIRLWFHIKFL